MEDGNPKKTSYEEVEITSLALRRLFIKTCLTYTPPGDEKSLDTSAIRVKSPFADFILYWEDLEAACHAVETDSAEDAVARKDLTQVMALIRKSSIEPYFKMRDALTGESSPNTIPYEYLWSIYRPGTMVYAKSYLDEWQMFEVVNSGIPVIAGGNCDSKNPAKYTNKKLLVTGAAFDWDGSRFYTFEYDFYITRDLKKSTPSIHSLEVFPTTYYRTETGERDDRKLRAELVQRGRKFWRFCNIQSDDIQCNYTGTVLTRSTSGSMGSQLTGDREDGDDDNSTSISDLDGNGATTFRKTEYSGHLVVDAGSYLRSQPWIGAEPPLGRLRTDVWVDADLECQW